MSEGQQYFATISQDWDRLRRSFFSDELREVAIAKADLTSDMAAADIGIGTGFMALGLASLVQKIYGIDSSPEMLAVARRNLQDFDNVELTLAGGENIPFPDEAVDAVFANMYLHHALQPLEAIKEIARILKRDGRLVITDLDEHNHTWLREEMADLWLGFNRDEVAEWFVAAGLKDVEVTCAKCDCCATSSEGEPAAISIFVASGRR